MRRAAVVAVVGSALLAFGAAAAGARVLRVGSYHGIAGQYRTIQSAVRAARAGDWILIAPGDYKTAPNAITTPKGHPDFPAAVVITKARLHIRGMNRNTVIVDGTRPGSPACSRRGAAQNFGLAGRHSSADNYAMSAAARSGENGLMVYKAPDVSIENLTACNFLGGARNAGNAIWWNGGDNSGRIGGHGYYGAYLSATSTYLKGKSKAGEFSAAQYGIFSSNWSGGTWDHIYASNFNDSGFYIGACQQVCDQTLNHGHAEDDALGYSGTNSGGRLLIENSRFDRNENGLNIDSENDDEPAPQNGSCPVGVPPPVAASATCWVFFHNVVADNNNPDVPAAGDAAQGPVGTGFSISGAHNDTVLDNRFVDNDAWGVIAVPYPDKGKPCLGGVLGGPIVSQYLGPKGCLWDESGIALIDNRFGDNGSYGHPTNGDIGQLNLLQGVTDCYRGNTEIGGGPLRGSESGLLQSTYPACTGASVAPNLDVGFFEEVACDSQTIATVSGLPHCPTGPYPRVTKIVMHPLAKQPTMPHPCAGVPRNPWCSRRH